MVQKQNIYAGARLHNANQNMPHTHVTHMRNIYVICEAPMVAQRLTRVKKKYSAFASSD